MSAPTHLLERARQLIAANLFQDAESLLDAVVRVEPENVEAWMTHLRIRQNQHGLDWLKERALKTKELSEADKNEIISYHLYLSQQLSGVRKRIVHANSFTPQQGKKEETPKLEESAVRFELVDVFNYPEQALKIEPRSKPRRRALYSDFFFDILRGILKAAAQDPRGKKTAGYIQNAIALANDFIKNPRDVYAKYAELPHFEKAVAFVLFGIFAAGVRLAISGYFIGYVFLGIFVTASGWLLVNFGNLGANMLIQQTRIYLQENKTELPTLEKVSTEKENNIQ